MGPDDLELLHAVSEDRSEGRCGKGMHAAVGPVEDSGAGDYYLGEWPWERSASRSGLSGLSGLSRIGLAPSARTEVGAGLARPEMAGPLRDKSMKVRRDPMLRSG